MEVVRSTLPLIILAVPLLAPPLILLLRKRPNLREAATFAVAGVLFLMVAAQYGTVLGGTELRYTVVELFPGVPLELRIDPLGLIFALVASSLWILTTLFSVGYMRGHHEKNQTRFYAYFALALFSTIGVAFSANLLTLYLFYEALSLSTYPLVAHHQGEQARSAGRMYLTNLFGTSLGLVLPAMLILYAMANTLDFTPGGFLDGTGSNTVLVVLLLMLVFGFAKAALMPFHSWLPNAMVAPTPVSALLHAVAVVKVGVFSIIRVITEVFGPDLVGALTFGPMSAGTLVATIASVTLILSSLMAYRQDNLKRVLAFSTIGQLAYIVLAVSILLPKAMTAAMVHIAFHAFGKITLFFCAGAFFIATHQKTISGLSGIGRVMPITASAFLIGAVSVIGLPPTAGFMSKWAFVLGAFQANQLVFIAVLLASSLLKAGYFFPIIFTFFFGKPAEAAAGGTFNEAAWQCVLPLTLTALASLVFFFYPEPFFNLAELAVGLITGADP